MDRLINTYRCPIYLCLSLSPYTLAPHLPHHPPLTQPASVPSLTPSTRRLHTHLLLYFSQHGGAPPRPLLPSPINVRHHRRDGQADDGGGRWVLSIRGAHTLSDSLGEVRNALTPTVRWRLPAYAAAQAAKGHGAHWSASEIQPNDEWWG